MNFMSNRLPKEQLPDPTYNKKEIVKNPAWHIAWIISQCVDDEAPLGWSKRIWIADQIVKELNVKPTRS